MSEVNEQKEKQLFSKFYCENYGVGGSVSMSDALNIWMACAKSNATQSELAALREELDNCKDTYKKLRNKKVESEQRLADAERRNADQLKLIGGLVEYADNLLGDVNNAWSYAGSTGNPEAHKDQDYAEAVALIAALTKPEEAKS